MIRATAIALSALVPVGAAGAPRPPVALTASPSHVTLIGADRRLIRVANPGAESVVVDAEPAGFSLGAHGRPRIALSGADARRAVAWLEPRPFRVVLAPGGSTELTLASSPPPSAAPGDHAAVLLLTTRPTGAVGVAVRMRIGVTVVVRVRGAIRHRLVARSLRVRSVGHRRMLELVIANTGNVVERVRRGRLRISLLAGGHRVARLEPAPRELLPRTNGTFELPYPGAVHGLVRAVVALSPGPGRILLRSFDVRL